MPKTNGCVFLRSEKNWQPNVVEDGALITGQSSASATPIAEAFANRLSRACVAQTGPRQPPCSGSPGEFNEVEC